ncbi:hypothetical protein [Crocosphaera chwakensis]|uniref:Biotin carboxylase n=1 Tax=Crocosphaera chwakensis CCY0110 TaxID=391612 RepID=A3IUQ0_9CHRO|nr:hypothetical protein [Crocosphaera chwakensis]EAZ89842.1 hypothetical protein CY0110_25446 [Crocosphaera chwakensis CCY0110]
MLQFIKTYAIATIIGCVFSLLTSLWSQPALALTNIDLFNISYKDCPPELAEGNVTSGGSSLPADCYIITGKAKNTSGKTVYDADVFGRILDANNEPALQNRSRVGSIAEVPPGVSDFEVRITVPANQPTPLKLKKFKASGFTTKVTPIF